VQQPDTRFVLEVDVQDLNAVAAHGQQGGLGREAKRVDSTGAGERREKRDARGRVGAAALSDS